ncbi:MULTISPECIES: hypothetical protein [Streptomyces]|uniref:hypothetical protein n=1 Tax=Streptomyces TaxID=1883 RepID=UPI00345BD638
MSAVSPHKSPQLRGAAPIPDGAPPGWVAVQLKVLPFRGRFPKTRIELPAEAGAHVANQVGVPAADMALYDITPVACF